MFKEGKRRKKEDQSAFNTKSLTRIVLSIFFACLVWGGAIAFESYILSDKDIDTAVVAKKEVKAGTYIDDSNRNEYFTEETIDAKLVSGQTLQSVDDIEGQATVDIAVGEPVTKSRFSNTAQISKDIENPILTSFGVDNASNAVNGGVRRGDIVNVVIVDTTDPTGSGKVILKNAYIVQAYDSNYAVISDGDTTSQALYFSVYIDESEVGQFTKEISDNTVTVVKNMTANSSKDEE